METAMEEGEESYPNQDEERDITRLCRVCANPNEYLIPIYHGEGLEHDLKAKISRHLPIEVQETDCLPLQLCYQCASTLIAWHDMVTGCSEADAKLRALLPHDQAQLTLDEKTGAQVQQQVSKESTKDSQGGNNALRTEFTGQDVSDEVTMGDEMSHQRFDGMEKNLRGVKRYNQVNGFHEDFGLALEDEIMSDFESDEDEEYTTYYSCNICGESNMEISTFLRHSKTHPREERKKILDKLVDYKLVEESAAMNAAAAYGFTVQSSVDSSVPLFHCTVCGQGNLLLKQLTEHSNLHPRFIDSHFCNLCQKQFNTAKLLNKHLECHLDCNDLVCQYCNKRFNMIEDLESHENSHYRAEFVCVECRQTFQSRSNIMHHLTLCHSTANFCHICAGKFESSIKLENHFINHTMIRALKRITKWFPCEICPRKFDNKTSFQRHVLFLHNSRMPLICEECGYTSFHEDALHEHIIKEHSMEPAVETEMDDAPMCMCDFCGENVPEDEISSHLEQHKGGVICYLCNKPFESQWELNKHINKIHTGKFKSSSLESGVYPYKCELCPASFRLDFELENHLETHRQLLYQCQLCFEEFTEDDELQSHIQNHDTSSDIEFIKVE